MRISSVRVRLVTDFDFRLFFAINPEKKRDLKTGAFFHYRLGPQDLVHVIFREIDIFGPLPRHAFSMKSSLIPGFGSVSCSENCDLLTNGIPLGQKNDFWLFALYNDDPCPRKSAFLKF